MTDVLEAYEAAVARRESSELEDQLAKAVRDARGATLRTEAVLKGFERRVDEAFCRLARAAGTPGADPNDTILAIEARAKLPVLRTCGACAWCGPTSGGWSCDHERSVAALQAAHPELSDCPQGGHVDHDAAPPTWCPLRQVNP